MSVARNSHMINQPEANGALVLPPPPPPLHYCFILRVFKATESYTERKEGERRI